MHVKILTEAGSQIGYGHFFRCLSLYDELMNRGVETQMILYGESLDSNLIGDRNIINQNWLDENGLHHILSDDSYVIVDSYLADRKKLQEISEVSQKVLYIDDTNRLDYPKGILVNPSLSGNYLNYPNTTDQKVLTGKEYIILRDSFLTANRKTDDKQFSKALVMIGGTDVENITEVVLKAICLQYPQLSFDVVVSRDKIEYFKKKYNHHNLTFYTNLSADEISDIMSNIEFAITGAGQTIFELIYLEIPFVTIQVIENQKYNAKAVKEFLMDELLLQSNDSDFLNKLNDRVEYLTGAENRIKLSTQMRGLIDGQGSKRIVDEFLRENILIREAITSDMESIFELSNQQYVRQYSIHKEKIKWADHVNWYHRILADTDSTFYIVTNDSDDVLGQVRFNVNEDNHAVVSISLSETIKGKGYSKKILMDCLNLYFKENNRSSTVIAYISPKNVASIKLFKGLGFEILSEKQELLKLMLKEEEFNVH